MHRTSSSIFKAHTGTLLRQYNLLVAEETLESVRNMDKRIEARELLYNIAFEHRNNPKSAKVFTMVNELFRLLDDHFIPTVPPTEEEMVREIGLFFRYNSKTDRAEWRNEMWRTCYNATFAVYIVREGLAKLHIPMVQASGWKPFAHNYCGLVMSA
jgi:hypothetical protein